MRAKVAVTKEGFRPKKVSFVQGRPAVIEFTRTEESHCLNAVRMPWTTKATPLPMNQPVAITIPDTSRAGSFKYACWMDMVFGEVGIEPPGPADVSTP